jgi:hypothetical protein
MPRPKPKPAGERLAPPSAPAQRSPFFGLVPPDPLEVLIIGKTGASGGNRDGEVGGCRIVEAFD